MMEEKQGQQWLVIRNWDKFQHYHDRQPIWIKNYTELLHDEAYLRLPEGTALVLHRLWLAYASTRARLPLDTRWLSRQINVRVTKQQLETLNHAGFIEFSASKPLATRYQDASATRALARGVLRTPKSGPANGLRPPGRKPKSGTQPDYPLIPPGEKM